MGNTILLIIAGFSLGYNILQKNKIKLEKLQKERNYKIYLDDMKEHKLEIETLQKTDGNIIESLELELKDTYETIRLNRLALNEKEQEIVESRTDLYNLDWAYDELMKAFNSNALDLYFWNLLPKSDRETRRKFIKNGQYKVYSLEDGRVAFEVI